MSVKHAAVTGVGPKTKVSMQCWRVTIGSRERNIT